MQYLISKNTILVTKKGNNTLVYENNNSNLINKQIINIMDNSCKYYGSSLKGRIEGTNYLLGSIYKAPIIISEKKEIIMFPTSSFNSDDCTWINYNWIDNYYCNGGRTIICFKNGLKIELNISPKVINNQILRSSRLESILKSKKH